MTIFKGLGGAFFTCGGGTFCTTGLSAGTSFFTKTFFGGDDVFLGVNGAVTLAASCLALLVSAAGGAFGVISFWTAGFGSFMMFTYGFGGVGAGAIG